MSNIERSAEISQAEFLDSLSNMLEFRVSEAEDIEEVKYCISVCVEEWVAAYNIVITGE